MIYIQARKVSIGYGQHIYVGVTKGDEQLIKHLTNSDCFNDVDKDEILYIAAAHDWKITILE